jgi:hypothetical protein
MAAKITNLTDRVIHAYLDENMARRVRSHATNTGRAISGIVSEALTIYYARLDFLDETVNAGFHQLVLPGMTPDIATPPGEASPDGADKNVK